MDLGSRDFAESNTALLMPLRTAILVLLKMVPPLVRQNPRHLVNCGGGRRNPESKSCVSFSNGRWRKKTHTRVTRYTMQGGTCNTTPQHSATVSLLQAMILVRGNFVPKIAAVPCFNFTRGATCKLCVKNASGIFFFNEPVPVTK